jgi:hypothetical protein
MQLHFPHIPQLSRARALACALAVCALFAAFGAAQNASAAITVSFTGDTLNIIGDDHPDALSVRGTPGDSQRIDIDFGNDGTIDRQPSRLNFSSIVIDTGPGDDSVVIGDDGGFFTDGETTVVRGGIGSDVLLGGHGPETFVGGQGADSILGGPGDDFAIWNPGDGSDSFFGQDGFDTLKLNGSNASEKIVIGPNGPAVHLSRDVGLVEIEGEGVELFNIATIGGSDSITAGDLAGRTKLKIDSGESPDTVVGSDGPDTISGGLDGDVLHGRGGEDTIAGNDGVDQLFGDAGRDVLDGGPAGDSIACGGLTGGFADIISNDPLDTVNPDCFANPTPPPPPLGTPPPADPGSPPPADPGSPPPADPGTPPPPGPGTTLPAPTARGFAKPVVKATRTGLVVKLHSTSSKPIVLKLKVVEAKRRYKRITKTLAPGARLTVKLKAPARLRKALARHPRRTRHPKVTVVNLANGGKLTVKPRL